MFDEQTKFSMDRIWIIDDFIARFTSGTCGIINNSKNFVDLSSKIRDLTISEEDFKAYSTELIGKLILMMKYAELLRKLTSDMKKEFHLMISGETRDSGYEKLIDTMEKLSSSIILSLGRLLGYCRKTFSESNNSLLVIKSEINSITSVIELCRPINKVLESIKSRIK